MYLMPNREAAAAARLRAIGELYDAWTLRSIPASQRVWEVGAGDGGIARALAARGAHVLATDIDLAAIGDFPNAMQHDIARDPPPAGDFDVVHARCLLTHVSDRDRALATMIAALRPGGTLVLEEPDPGLQPLACVDERGPAEARANRIRRAFRALLTTRGADLEFGRKLPHLVRAAGLADVRAEAYLVIAQPACRELELATVALLRDQLAIAPDDLDAHVAAVAAAELDLAQPPLVTVTARKPGT